MSITGANPKKSIPHSCVDFTVAVIGTGATAPAVPANGNFTPTTNTYPRRANRVSTVAAEAPTRTGAGVYVITIADKLANILFVKGETYSAGGSPTGALQVDVTKIDAANRKITVAVFSAAGVATDIGTSDMLVLWCHAQDSGV